MHNDLVHLKEIEVPSLFNVSAPILARPESAPLAALTLMSLIRRLLIVGLSVALLVAIGTPLVTNAIEVEAQSNVSLLRVLMNNQYYDCNPQVDADAQAVMHCVPEHAPSTVSH
jgi:hypothetical protein